MSEREDLMELARKLVDPVRRVLSKPGNERLREEWESLKEEEAAIISAFQNSFVATDMNELMGAASYVSRNIASFVMRRRSILEIIQLMVERDASFLAEAPS